jgi:predicted dehydrogenase
VVLVCSPHHLHYEQAKAALQAGAHVLCEKPMTLDPAQAWELAALAERTGLHLLVPNNHNYLPHLGRLSDRIADGLVGDVEHVACSMISGTREVFVGGAGLKRWDSSFFRPDRATWQNPSAGGGFAWGQMSHSFALSFLLTGLVPDRVAALVRRDEGVDIGDSAVLGFAGGANGAYSGSVAMPQSSKALMRVFIAGSRGLVTVECDPERCDIRLNDGTIESLPIRPGEWLVDAARPVNAFVDLALGQGRNLSDGRIGAMTVATIHAMMESARDGGAMRKVMGAPD